MRNILSMQDRRIQTYAKPYRSGAIGRFFSLRSSSSTHIHLGVAIVNIMIVFKEESIEVTCAPAGIRLSTGYSYIGTIPWHVWDAIAHNVEIARTAIDAATDVITEVTQDA